MSKEEGKMTSFKDPNMIKDFIERMKNRHDRVSYYSKIDLSEKSLDAALKKRYGKTGKELQKDTRFNIWEAYSFLKKHTGLSDVYFTEEGYRARMDAIQNVLGVR